MNKLHRFIKMAGCSSEEEFYSRYKDEKDFFKEYPLAKYHTSDGQADVSQNQKMPPDRSVKNEFRNAKEEKRSVPKSKEYKKGGCHECDMMKYQVGGNFPAGNIYTDNYSHIFNEQGQMDFTPDTRPTPAVSTEYYQRRMVPNPVTGVGEMQQVRVAAQADPSSHYGISQSPAYNYGTTSDFSTGITGPAVATSGAALGSENYSLDRIREQDGYKKGGWIQKAIKHPGRCTPGSPNYDCPKGSPQWNLAQRFRRGDLHKAQFGEQVNLPNTSNNPWTAGTNFNQNLGNTPVKKALKDSFFIDETSHKNRPKISPDYPTTDPLVQNAPIQPTNNVQGLNTSNNVNPWMVGAGVLGAGLGALAGYSAIQNNLEKQSNFANYQREQGLTSNAYQARNPQGSQGDFGQVGQAYGMFRPNQQVPAKGGNRFAKNGGHGTWDGAMGVYFQEGGQAGFEKGSVMDLSPAQIQAMTKKGYRFEIVD